MSRAQGSAPGRCTMAPTCDTKNSADLMKSPTGTQTSQRNCTDMLNVLHRDNHVAEDDDDVCDDGDDADDECDDDVADDDAGDGGADGLQQPLDPSSEPEAQTREELSSRLAFNFDSSNLDENGTPRKKVARKLSRNESEKMRRDRLNAYTAELARLVPFIIASDRKLDKASVLRLTVTYLRIYRDLIKSNLSPSNWKPNFFNSDSLGSTILESIGGFMLVVDRHGILIFATDGFQTTLGHSLVDKLGTRILRIIHKEDRKILLDQFKGFNPDPGKRDASALRSFDLRMMIKTHKPAVRYENLHIVGQLKVMPALQDNNFGPMISMRREPEVCLIGVARLRPVQKLNELFPSMDSNSNQWITRHELNGMITFSDQRGAILTGFLPGESVGLSPYSLVHPDDIDHVISLHKSFLENGTIPTTNVFRMYTKTRDIIYIENSVYMVLDMWTSEPRFIINVNSVIGGEEGERQLSQQKGALIMLTSSSSASSSESNVENSNSQDSKDEDSSQNSSPVADPMVIPEIKIMTDGKIHVVVGDTTHEISTSPNGKIKPRERDYPAIFDPHFHEDDSAKIIPLTKPRFIGDDAESASSPYDGVNSYLGNDPQIVGGDYMANGKFRNNYSRSGLQKNSDESALSNIEAMFGGDTGYLQHSNSESDSCSRKTVKTSIEKDTPKLTPDSSSSHLHMANGQVQSNGISDSSQNLLQWPSTGAEQNPLLVQLLNKKPVHNIHLRETLTSHLVPDIGSSAGEKGAPDEDDASIISSNASEDFTDTNKNLRISQNSGFVENSVSDVPNCMNEESLESMFQNFGEWNQTPIGGEPNEIALEIPVTAADHLPGPHGQNSTCVISHKQEEPAGLMTDSLTQQTENYGSSQCSVEHLSVAGQVPTGLSPLADSFGMMGETCVEQPKHCLAMNDLSALHAAQKSNAPFSVTAQVSPSQQEIPQTDTDKLLALRQLEMRRIKMEDALRSLRQEYQQHLQQFSNSVKVPNHSHQSGFNGVPSMPEHGSNHQFKSWSSRNPQQSPCYTQTRTGQSNHLCTAENSEILHPEFYTPLDTKSVPQYVSSPPNEYDYVTQNDTSTDTDGSNGFGSMAAHTSSRIATNNCEISENNSLRNNMDNCFCPKPNLSGIDPNHGMLAKRTQLEATEYVLMGDAESQGSPPAFSAANLFSPSSISNGDPALCANLQSSPLNQVVSSTSGEFADQVNSDVDSMTGSPQLMPGISKDALKKYLFQLLQQRYQRNGTIDPNSHDFVVSELLAGFAKNSLEEM